MKKLNLIYIKVLAVMLLLTACQEDDLPRANFDLDIVSVFSGEVAHEKVNLIWQTPAGNLTPESYVLSWAPNGEKIVLDATTTSYEISGLTNGTNYKFTIQANYGEAGFSGVNLIELVPKDQLQWTLLPGNKIAIAQWQKPNRTDISGYTLSWSPNGQTIQIPVGTNTYQITGLTNGVEYTVSLKINYTGGTTSNEVQALVKPGEISAYVLNVPSPMATDLVQFTYNPAYLPGSTAVSWSWNFGDGNTSTAQNPTNTYSKPGIYDVSIQIKDGNGTTFDDTKKVYVWGVKWAVNFGGQIQNQSPAIGSDGTIYLGSRLAASGNFRAIRPDGTEKWSYAGMTALTGGSASIGSDGTIYIGSADRNLHAINPDGSNKWKFLTGGAIAFSTPSFANDGTIYIGSEDDKLYAINPNGTQKWAFTKTGFNFRSTASIGSDGTIYMGSDDKNLYAINPDGTEKWAFAAGGIIQSGAAIQADGTIIIGVDRSGSAGAVIAVNPDGTQKWIKTGVGRITVCSPAVANGRVYIGMKEGNKLLALNASTGFEIWSFTTGGIVNASPAVDKNGVIYFGSYDDFVYALNPNGTLKYKFKTGSDVWSSPVIGEDGTVYIGSYDFKLYAFEMFAEGLVNDVWPMFAKNPKHTSR